jgi:hypothetical protein
VEEAVGRGEKEGAAPEGGDGRRRCGEERGRGCRLKMALTCGPHTSAVREREREGREAGRLGLKQ